MLEIIIFFLGFGLGGGLSYFLLRENDFFNFKKKKEDVKKNLFNGWRAGDELYFKSIKQAGVFVLLDSFSVSKKIMIVEDGDKKKAKELFKVDSVQKLDGGEVYWVEGLSYNYKMIFSVENLDLKKRKEAELIKQIRDEHHNIEEFQSLISSELENLSKIDEQTTI